MIGFCGHRWVLYELEESNTTCQLGEWYACKIPYSDDSSSSCSITVYPFLPIPFLSVKFFEVRNTHMYRGSRLYTIGSIDLTSNPKIVDPLDYNIYKLWTTTTKCIFSDEKIRH